MRLNRSNSFISFFRNHHFCNSSKNRSYEIYFIHNSFIPSTSFLSLFLYYSSCATATSFHLSLSSYQDVKKKKKDFFYLYLYFFFIFIPMSLKRFLPRNFPILYPVLSVPNIGTLAAENVPPPLCLLR